MLHSGRLGSLGAISPALRPRNLCSPQPVASEWDSVLLNPVPVAGCHSPLTQNTLNLSKGPRWIFVKNQVGIPKLCQGLEVTPSLTALSGWGWGCPCGCPQPGPLLFPRGSLQPQLRFSAGLFLLLGNLDSSALVRAALHRPWRVSVNLPTFLLSQPQPLPCKTTTWLKAKICLLLGQLFMLRATILAGNFSAPAICSNVSSVRRGIFAILFTTRRGPLGNLLLNKWHPLLNSFFNHRVGRREKP